MPPRRSQRLEDASKRLGDAAGSAVAPSTSVTRPRRSKRLEEASKRLWDAAGSGVAPPTSVKRRRRHTGPSFFMLVGDEVLTMILAKLPARQLVRVASVCTHWRQVLPRATRLRLMEVHEHFEDKTLDDIHHEGGNEGLPEWYFLTSPRPTRNEVLRLGGAAFTYFHRKFDFTITCTERVHAIFGRVAHVREHRFHRGWECWAPETTTVETQLQTTALAG